MTLPSRQIPPPANPPAARDHSRPLRDCLTTGRTFDERPFRRREEVSRNHVPLVLAIFAAASFSSRAVASHIVSIMLASGITLAMVGPSPGPPPVARWAVGGILLTIAATIMGRIAARRR